MENNNKKSKLIFDMRITRKLLKKNPTQEAKYCRYCGKLLSEHCGCQQPVEVVDVKPLRDHPESTIAVFENTEWFQKAFDEIMSELKSYKEEEVPVEQND